MALKYLHNNIYGIYIVNVDIDKKRNKMSRGVCNMSESENTIECISRKYRVHNRGGLIVEVESTKPLSGKITKELLEEDTEIDTFFSNHRIVGVRQAVVTPSKYQKEEVNIEKKLSPKGGRFTPIQRLNQLLKMKGEFSRQDYQKYISDMYGVKLGRYMAYDDLRSALDSKRLEVTGVKIGRERTYRVVDPTNVDETLYKTLMKDRKVQMGILQ